MEEAQILLDEHIAKTQAMRASPFAIPFMERVVPWEARLTRLQDIVDDCCVPEQVAVPGAHLQLRGDHEADPHGGRAFMKMDQTWRRLVEAIGRPAAMDAPEIPNLLEDLREATTSWTSWRRA